MSFGIDNQSIFLCQTDVREILRKEVNGFTLKNPSRSGEGGSREGERRGRWGRRTEDLQDGVSNEGGANALPS